MKPKNQPRVLRVQVFVADPPPGVSFAVQRGKSELSRPLRIEPCGLRFEFALRLGAPLQDGSFNFLGEFAQGSPVERFIYVNSGNQAGQAESCWDRRAKLKLSGISRELVEQAMERQDCAVAARINGTTKDGGPVCASVPSSAVEWRLVQHVA